MKVLATVWFWLVFIVMGTVGNLLLFPIWLLSTPFDPNRRLSHLLMAGWSFNFVRSWPGWRVRVTGREHLPRTAAVLVANHQSATDTLACLGLNHPFKFVAKAQLFNLPIFGTAMRMSGYVQLRRGKTRSMAEMMDRCRALLSAGESILIFPEGTYAKKGTRLPFKRGAFSLAVALKLPVVPIVIEGTRDLLDGDGPWFSPRAQVLLRILPPVLPQQLGEDDAKAAEQLRALFEREVRD